MDAAWLSLRNSVPPEPVEYMGRPCSFWDELCKGVDPGGDSPRAILEAGCHSPKLTSDLIGVQ